MIIFTLIVNTFRVQIILNSVLPVAVISLVFPHLDQFVAIASCQTITVINLIFQQKRKRNQNYPTSFQSATRFRFSKAPVLQYKR